MKKAASWGRLVASVLFAASLVAAPRSAFAEPVVELGTQESVQAPADAMQADNVTPQADASAPFAIEASHNGIPTVTVFVDESAQAIADARSNDPSHSFGTYGDLRNSSDHSVRCVGSVGLDVPEGYVSEYGSASVPEGMLKLEFLRGRGNTTWGDETRGYPDKRAFKFKLEEKADFFGMGASKEWLLMASTFDATLLKNRITSWLSSEIGMPYAPQMVPVDVVLVRIKDGQEIERKPLGSYCLSEQVDIEPGRIAIDKLKKDVSDDEGITGGFLLSKYESGWNYDEPQSNVFGYASNMQFYSRSPRFESDSLPEGQAKQRAYIDGYLKRVDDLVMGVGDAYGTLIDEDRHHAIGEVMDLRSAADYWWIQAFSDNADAYKTDSTYLYKPRGGKLCWGPVWDFDLAWSYMLGEQHVCTGMGRETAWFRMLRSKDPYFVELIKERWRDPKDGLEAKLIELTRPGGKLDAYRDEIRASWEANEAIDGEIDASYRPVGRGTLDEFVEALRTWIDMRREWMSANLSEVGTKFVYVSYVVDGKECKREVMDREDPHLSWPKAPCFAGREFEGWCLEGSDEVIAKADAPSDLFELKRNANWDYAGWGLKGSDEVVLCPEPEKDVVFVAKYRSKPEFVKDAEVVPVCDGRIAYCASVVFADVDACDWSDAHMTFTVRPTCNIPAGAQRDVKVPLDQAIVTKGEGGVSIATFTLPLSAIEMGQMIVSEFHFTDHGEPVGIEQVGTLQGQIDAYVKSSADQARVDYAMAMCDFGRYAHDFLSTYGKVTSERYSPMSGAPYKGWTSWGDAMDAMERDLDSIGAGKDFAGSQVKKVGMSLRFDSKTTAQIDIHLKKAVRGFEASATCKGKQYKAKKISDTQYRISVSGLRAQDLGELIEIGGNAGGAFSMRCSALSYAYGVMESGAYETRGLNLMAALYGYHTAAQAIAK